MSRSYIRIAAILLVVFGTVACDLGRPQTHNPRVTAESFSEFMAMEAPKDLNQTADCTQPQCLNLRSEFRYTVFLDTHAEVEASALAVTLEESITNATSDTDYTGILQTWSASIR
jgi:hypothetical protein